MSPDKKTLDDLRIDRSGNAPREKSRLPLVVGVSILIVLMGGLALWFNRPKIATVRTVTVRESASGGDKTLLNASGYVTARREATVSSKITAKVIEVLVEEGMKVDAGQVLARLDASNLEKSFNLSEAQAEAARKSLDETKANLTQAESELKRTTRLAKDQVASQSDLDRAEALAKSLQARLDRQQADVAVAEREVAVWKQQLDDAVIRAPFAGIVTSKNAQPGEMISPMSSGGFTRTGICTLVDMSSLEIEVDVSESYINRVEAGQPVEATLDSYPDLRIPAKVIAIIPTADRQKATVKVRVGFDKLDPRVLPDMGVKVAFQRADAGQAAPVQAAGSVLPKTAVHQSGGQDVVWLVRDGRVERRAVKIGMTRGDDVTIIAGVSDGDRVVIQAPDNLADGTKVKEQQ
ncbi:MAG: efflux transporter, family, subunit [Verrucomicrobiales bacterium]|nr:efflux transporter, family, subunit [Verrucomicrobiales bacterium]